MDSPRRRSRKRFCGAESKESRRARTSGRFSNADASPLPLRFRRTNAQRLAQLNHVAVLLSLATLDGAGYAIRYQSVMANALSDFSRDRFPFGYHAALSGVNEDTRRAVPRDGNSVATRFTDDSAAESQ